jgi:hypothetical protein
LVEDGRSGRIFPAGNLEELKGALLEVTAEGALPRFKAESRALLARYREEVDPVAEVRRALVDTGILKKSESHDQADIVTPTFGR